MFGLLALIAAVPAGAQTLDTNCHYQWDPGRVLRNRPADERARYVGGALYYCQNADQLPYIAELIDPPRRDDVGLCYFGTQSIKLERSPSGDLVEPGGAAVGLWPSGGQRMLRRDGECPRQDDPRYIDNRNVPDDLFLALLNFWDDIRLSPGDFDKAVAPGVAARTSALKGWLARPETATKLRIGTIETAPGWSAPANGERAVHFRLTIETSPHGGGFFLDVDRSGDKWRIANVTDFKT